MFLKGDHNILLNNLNIQPFPKTYMLFRCARATHLECDARAKSYIFFWYNCQVMDGKYRRQCLMKRFFQLILIVTCCYQLWAAELYVRTGDYSSIQAAIDDANNSDTVIVDPCTYYENINFLGKAIT